MRFDHPVRTPLWWLVAPLIVFGWLGQALAARPAPCSAEVLKAMSDCGMSGYEAERVCYYATRYFNQNQTLSGAEALLRALRKLGLAQDFILEKISNVLFHDERAMLKLNEPKSPAVEPRDGAKMEWELQSRKRDPLARPETERSVPNEDEPPSAPPSLFNDPPWYKVDEHALLDEKPSDPIGDLKEDLDLMLKLELKF
jgi:hypothetical protein